MTPAARLAAAGALLEQVLTGRGRPADAIAQEFFRERRYIGSADRRAVSDFAWFAIRAHRRLGWWLGQAGLPDRVTLRLAASLLLRGWTLEGVAQLHSGAPYAPARLAEADLARLARLEGASPSDPAMDRATATELPYWLVARMEARFGADFDRELAALLEEAPLDLRVNLLKATREEAQAALAAEGIETEPTPHSGWGLRAVGRRPVVTGAAFRGGLVEIQDEGSQLLAALVGAEPDMRVLDYCAGAGGKTLALAMMMRNRGHVVAADVAEYRLEAARDRLRRAGVHNVERHLLVAGDKWRKRRAGSFDRVLVDAPCSGTGSWRRNPDARLRLTETDLAELIVKQQTILRESSALVKRGGRLIYATCSLLIEENEDQVARFLSDQAGFRAGAPPLRLTPASHGTDGFFAQILEREA